MAMHDLWPENIEAWRLFHQLATRFVVDLTLGSVVFDRVTQDWSASEVETMTARLGTIYETLVPPKGE